MKTKEPPYTGRYVRWCGRSVDKIIIYLLPDLSRYGLLLTYGFDIGDYISVTCEDGKLVIAQDAERAAVKAAEAEYMEREMKALQKRYEAEKVKIRAQMVAEPGARW